ncbi:MAG: hypothetical protein AABY15_01350, partial [Nanoarchaeota archaeon]
MSTLEDIKKIPFVAEKSTGDLSKPLKECLATFLSKKTIGEEDSKQKNAFPIESEFKEISLTDTSGIPSKLNDSNDNKYASSQENPSLDEYSTSKYYTQVVKTEFGGNFIKKGESSDIGIDGNSLLKGIKNSETTIGKKTNKFVSSVLKNNNRFNLDNGQFFSAVKETSRISSIQKNIGVYKKDAQPITFDALKNIGPSLSLRSSGEWFARNEGADPNNIEIQASSLLPGEAQLINPLGMDVSDLKSEKVLHDILLINADNEDIRSMLNKSETELLQTSERGRITGVTHGNMNNYLEQFSGLLPVGMIALHAALAAASFVGIQVLMVLLGGFAKPSRILKDKKGAYTLGRFLSTQSESEGLLSDIFLSTTDIGKAIGLKPLQFDFQTCVNKGFSVFYGLEDGTFADKLNKIALDSPGYFAIFSRMLTRSVNSIASSVEDAINSGGPLEIVNSITGIIDTVK